MQIERIQASNFLRDQWAHGSSMQLSIYPPGASYRGRDFLWRVSSASVEQDMSEFTVLYGVTRWILPLDFTMELRHSQNEKPLYSIVLKPFESHCFRGDWLTVSKGMGQDFNLMLNDGADGVLTAVDAPTHEDAIAHQRLASLFPEAFAGAHSSACSQLVIGAYSPDVALTLEIPGEPDASSHEPKRRMRIERGDLALIHGASGELSLLAETRLCIAEPDTRSASDPDGAAPTERASMAASEARRSGSYASAARRKVVLFAVMMDIPSKVASEAERIT